MANKFTDAVHAMILPGTSKNRVTLKAILMAMAWHTDNKGGTFWGSYGTFAHEANCSRQAVKENVPKAVELGLLEIIGERPTRNGPCNIYRMNLEAVLKLSYQGAVQPGGCTTGLDSVEDQGAQQRHQGAQQRHQGAEHTKNSSLNSSVTRQMNSSSIHKASSLRSADQEQPQHPVPWQIDEDDSPNIPVHSPAPQAIAVPPAPSTRESRVPHGPWLNSTNGIVKDPAKAGICTWCKECGVAFNMRDSKSCKAVPPCPEEETDIDAVDVSKPEVKETPKVDFTNPVHTHDWSTDKNVCARCSTTRDEARYENIRCEAVGAAA